MLGTAAAVCLALGGEGTIALADGVAVAATHSGTTPRLYVANQFDGTVTVLHPETLRRLATIPVGFNTNVLAASPDGRRLYVAVPTSRDEIVVIDTATNREIGAMPAPGHVNGLVVSRDGKTVYATMYNDGTFTSYDTATLTPLRSVGVSPGGVGGGGLGPVGVALANGKAYVALGALGRGAVTVIDTATMRVLDVLDVPGATGVRGAETDPSGRFVYLSGDAGTQLAVVDSRTDRVRSVAVARNVSPEFGADGIEVIAGRVHLLVASRASLIAIRQVGTLHSVGPLRLGPCLGRFELASDRGRNLFVTCHFVDRLAVVDRFEAQPIRMVSVGDGPLDVEYVNTPRSP